MPLAWTGGHLTWKSGHLSWGCPAGCTTGCGCIAGTSVVITTATLIVSGFGPGSGVTFPCLNNGSPCNSYNGTWSLASTGAPCSQPGQLCAANCCCFLLAINANLTAQVLIGGTAPNYWWFPRLSNSATFGGTMTFQSTASFTAAAGAIGTFTCPTQAGGACNNSDFCSVGTVTLVTT